MSRRIKYLVGLTIVSLMLSACVSPDESEVVSPLSSPLSAPSTGSDVSQELKSTPTDHDEEQAVVDARKALAEQLAVEPDAIELISVERVDFGDTSLGCPQPGMMYAQIITPGYKVVFERGGKTYDMRVSGKRAVLCKQATDEKSLSLKDDTGTLSKDQAQAAETAKKALAEAQEVSPDQIEIVSVESVQFSDSSLGCPQPGMVYLQVITPGYRVLLRLDGQTYDYRISGQQALLCSSK